MCAEKLISSDTGVLRPRNGSNLIFIDKIVTKPDISNLAIVDENLSKSFYKIVYDNEELKRFASIICSGLPPSHEEKQTSRRDVQGLCKLMMLLAREKYVRAPENGGYRFPKDGNMHLTRTLISTNDPEHFLSMAKRYETEIGLTYMYWNKDSGQNEPIPNKALCLYIDLSTKSMVRAWNKHNQQISQDLLLLVENRENQETINCIKRLNRLMSGYKSAIHETNAINLDDNHLSLLDIDIDTKTEPVLQLFMKNVFGIIEPSIAMIIETHGGYHILLDKKLLNAEMGKQLFKFFDKTESNKFHDKDRNGNSCSKRWISHNNKGMVPCPGTLQGGFPVRMISISEFKAKCMNEEKSAVRCNRFRVLDRLTSEIITSGLPETTQFVVLGKTVTGLDLNSIKEEVNNNSQTELHEIKIINTFQIKIGEVNHPIMLLIPSNYPFSEPRVYFVNSITHNNIDPRTRMVCWCITKWSPLTSLTEFVQEIQLYLNNPSTPACKFFST